MFKVFRYRLYPTNAQRLRLESVLETCRRFHETEGRTIGKTEQLRRVKVHKINNPVAAQKRVDAMPLRAAVNKSGR